MRPAGGGIVSLTVAAENLADHVLMVELDNQVAAVWHAILEGDGYWLADRIVTFDLTPENVETIMAKKPRRIRNKAFQTLLKNRIYRGGLLARGSGMLKYGEHGKGMNSRWYPQTLKKRITAIIEMRDRITFIEDDGLEVMKEYAFRPDAVFFVVPP